jgi:hypothetical protein
MGDDMFFERISEGREPLDAQDAPARLKARIYSALVRRQQESGPLLDLPATAASGRWLCVFEELVRIMPLGDEKKCFNLCGVCHARVLAEQLEAAPIYWPNCPYVAFQKRGGGS